MLDTQSVLRELTCPLSSSVKWKERATGRPPASQTSVARNFRRWPDLAKIESAGARNITNISGKKLQEVVRFSQD